MLKTNKDKKSKNNKVKRNMNMKTKKYDFNELNEYSKLFNFKTSGSKIIRKDVMIYVIKNFKRSDAILKIAKYVDLRSADKIESGILEETMIRTSNEKPDVIDISNSIYEDRVRDICINLDRNNKKINNQTLQPSVMNGKINPYYLAFMPPHHIHPVAWFELLERRRNAEQANNEQKVTDIYKCYKCGDRKSTTTQQQTRSADEPMTIFVTCLTCYNTFTTQ